MPLFDHFNFLAPFYDRAIQLNNIEELKKFINLPTQGILLDAGGGTGRVAKELVGLADNIFVADLSMNMLRQAQEKTGLLLVRSHTELYPFPNGIFDRVIMIDAMHHVCDHQQTADEMWRVLKPGGRIVIEEPDIRNTNVKLVAIAEKIALMRSHFINPVRIAGMFTKWDAKIQIEVEDFNTWVIIDKDA